MLSELFGSNIKKTQSQFKKEFLYNLSLTDKEVEHLLNNILMEVAVINPVTKKSVTCSGKVYDWELL